MTLAEEQAKAERRRERESKAKERRERPANVSSFCDACTALGISPARWVHFPQEAGRLGAVEKCDVCGQRFYRCLEHSGVDLTEVIARHKTMAWCHR